MVRSHRMPFGAEVQADGKVQFCLWAPAAKEVAVCLGGEPDAFLPLNPARDGWFEIVTDRAAVGSKYSFQINRGTKVPDPGSRLVVWRTL